MGALDRLPWDLSRSSNHPGQIDKAQRGPLPQTLEPCRGPGSPPSPRATLPPSRQSARTLALILFEHESYQLVPAGNARLPASPTLIPHPPWAAASAYPSWLRGTRLRAPASGQLSPSSPLLLWGPLRSSAATRYANPLLESAGPHGPACIHATRSAPIRNAILSTCRMPGTLGARSTTFAAPAHGTTPHDWLTVSKRWSIIVHDRRPQTVSVPDLMRTERRW
jgi:hypothetical protein